MKSLPAEIISSAFKADDGEYAWRPEAISAALQAITDSGQSILGGDVWVIENGKIISLFPGARGFQLWSTGPRKPDETWPDYCCRTLDESLDEIEKIDLKNLLSQEQQQYVYYHPDYFEEHDVKELIPRNKHDHERAEAAVKAGYPAVEPILPELLQWLQDCNWPVASTLAPFLASIGRPLIPHLQQIFATDDQLWKYWIISHVISESGELAAAFRDKLEQIAYSPTESELESELNEVAEDALMEYGWGGI